MHVCNDPWIFEVNKGIVDKETTGGRGMEDVEVGVLDPRAIEVRRRKGLSMKGGRIFAIALASHSYKVSIFNAPITNVLSRFRLSFFVEKHDGVKVGLGSIISYPPFTRVVWVLEVTSEGRSKANGLRRGCGSSNGRLILCKADWLIAVNTVFAHVRLSEVYDAGNEEEMVDRFEIAVGGLEGFVVKTIVP